MEAIEHTRCTRDELRATSKGKRLRELRYQTYQKTLSFGQVEVQESNNQPR